MAEAAPLVVTPDAPLPQGGGAEWFTGQGGARLRGALFLPNGTPRGSIVLSSGRTEPIEKYFEVIGELTSRGFAVLVQEWRGQGLSHKDLPDRLKGHAEGYEPYMADYDALLAHFGSRLPKPWIAMGHSMGGCLTLLALAKGADRHFEACLLSAPMLGLRTGGIPRWAGALLASLNCLIGKNGDYVFGDPGTPFDDTFANNVLTSDPVRYARARGQIAADRDLALGAPTYGWLDFAFKATGWLAQPQNLKGITIPVVICSAEKDRLVPPEPQKAAADALPKGQFIVMPGSEHEVMIETDQIRAPFWAAFDELADAVAPARA